MPDQTPNDQCSELSRRSLIAGTASVALAGCSDRSDTSQTTPATRETEETADFPRGFATARDRHGVLEIMLRRPDEGVLRDEFLAEVVAYNGLPTADLESTNTVQVFSYEWEGKTPSETLRFDTSHIGPETVSELTPNVVVNLRVRVHNLTKDITRDWQDTAAAPTLSYVKYTDPETGESVTEDRPPEKSPVLARDTYHVRRTLFTKVPLDHWPDVEGTLNRSEEPYPATYPKLLLSFTFPKEKVQYAKYLRENDDVHVGGVGMVDFTYSNPDQFSQI